MAFKKKFAPRRKFCRFCADADLPLDYKRPDILRDYITERGKIIARRITGTCAKATQVFHIGTKNDFHTGSP